MSKKAIKAAGTRRWRAFGGTLAALALVVLGANLFSSQSANANGTITCVPNPAVVNTNTTCTLSGTVGATNIVWTVTGLDGAGVGTSSGQGTLAFTFTALQSTLGANPRFTVQVAYTDVNGSHTADEPGQTITLPFIGASGTVTAVNATGTGGTATFSLPANVLCASDPGPTGATPRTCTAADVSFTATGTAAGTVTSVTPSGNRDVAGTVVVAFTDTGVGTLTPVLRVYNAATGTAAANGFNVSTSAAKAVVLPNLRHISDTGQVITAKDVINNVRGSSHTICLVAPDNVTPLQVPQLTVNSFVVTNSGGYNGSAPVGPQTPTFTDPQIFIGTGSLATGGNGGLAGATCLRYISTGAGDQQISAEYQVNGINYTIDFDSANINNNNNGALVKEWNVLEGSTLGGAASGSGPVVITNLTIPVTLNPVTGAFTFSPVNVSDLFFGSHTDASNATVGPIPLAGVFFGLAIQGCGAGSVNGIPLTANVPVFGQTILLAPNGAVGYLINNVVSTSLVVTFTAGTNCGPSSQARIVFVGSETTVTADAQGNLGSGQGRIVAETVLINFSVVIPTKQVFLAWAGQRVILEHDWRIPPGDADGGTDSSVLPLGTCPVDFDFGAQAEQVETQSIAPAPFEVTYIKGSGPGNFLPALGTFENPVFINGSDQATVVVNGDDPGDNSQTDGSDIVAEPNDSCISRVLYESEDPGEVDIEAFISEVPARRVGIRLQEIDNQIGGFGASKVAFVIYYMKLNTVGVSLVDDVAKPRHNATGTDYSPGNPWDASKDVTAVDWNVSKDLLVRGRVKGWFLNSNPSGRAADTSDPLNVLPANRWVMPDDWALLAGGPADKADNSPSIGTAENFRPQYDIMINPARGNRGLDTPEGTFLAAASTLGADLAATGTTVTIRLPQSGTIVNGATIRIDNEDMTVISNLTPNALGTLATFTVNRGQGGTAPAAHVTGAIVLVYGAIATPFEGPYSLLDLPALGAGAALSDFDPNNIRDTIWKDGDVEFWDAPMPPALVTVDIRGTGFIKQVLKQDVYYNGTANSTAGQTYPNPYYIVDIPDSPWIAPIAAGGGYAWDTWGTDGPGGNGQGVYRFWTPIPGYANASVQGVNPAGVGESLSAGSVAELRAIELAYSDTTIGRTIVVYSDNHGEFMVTANGDFRTDLTACAGSPLGGATSKHCKPGDKVGTGSIVATADYPDFRGKHFPVASNTATVTWIWGGYKDVTVEAGETDQFKYVVFHGLDRDAFCSAASFGAVSLHPVLSGAANDTFNGNPAETIDFLIDSGEGIIIGSNSNAAVNVTKQFATGVLTFSTLENDPAVTGIKEFPLSSLAATGAVDECQAWIRVSNSLLGVLNVLVIAHDDFAEGDIGFDKIIDLTNTTSLTLNFRWSLITWPGADNISVTDALKGTGTSGKNPGGNDISASVTAVYGWDQAAQQWLGYFPTGVNVPGANDLTVLHKGQAYWIAITGPGSITWTVATNVN